MSKALFWTLAIAGWVVGVIVLAVAYRAFGVPIWLYLVASFVFGGFYGYFASRFYWDRVY